MKDLKEAKRILEEISKNAFPAVEIMDMPSSTDSTREMDLRARDENESIFEDEQHNLNIIFLSRQLMAIDTKKYGVDKKIANKLVEYIERNEDTALQELKMEYGHRINEYNNNIQCSSRLKREEFASDIDYERTKAFNYKKLKEFENKLNYLYDIISLLEGFKMDENHDRIKEKEKKKFQEDFDFSYLDTFWSQGYPLQ